MTSFTSARRSSSCGWLQRQFCQLGVFVCFCAAGVVGCCSTSQHSLLVCCGCCRVFVLTQQLMPCCVLAAACRVLYVAAVSQTSACFPSVLFGGVCMSAWCVCIPLLCRFCWPLASLVSPVNAQVLCTTSAASSSISSSIDPRQLVRVHLATPASPLAAGHSCQPTAVCLLCT